MIRLSAISILCLLTCVAIAQDTPPAKVTIPLLVEDSHHHPAINVARESLTVSQHKTAVTDFSLSSTADLPLRLGILLDVSDSERSSGLQQVTVAASDFARKLLRTPEDRVFFGAFSFNLMTTQWVGRAEVQPVVIPAKIGRGTALYDAIVGACKQMGEAGSTRSARRVLVIVSDGEDNQSHVTLQGAAAEAVRSGVVIFSVSTNKWSLQLRGDKAMENLARLTGGETISLWDRDAPKAFAKISELLDGLYLLNYVPVSVSSKQQDLQIKSANKEKM